MCFSAIADATTVLVSIKTGGGGPANGDSYTPMMNADGKYVLFRSKAANLAPDLQRHRQPFLYDLQFERYLRPYKTGAGASAMTLMAASSLTADRALAYVWDSQAAKTNYAITFSGTNSGAGISPDGNRIVYAFTASCTPWTAPPIRTGSLARLLRAAMPVCVSAGMAASRLCRPVNTTNQFTFTIF